MRKKRQETYLNIMLSSTSKLFAIELISMDKKTTFDTSQSITLVIEAAAVYVHF